MPHPVSRSNSPSEGNSPRRKARNATSGASSPPSRPRAPWWEKLWGNWFRLNLQAGEPIIHWRIFGLACALVALALGVTVHALVARAAHPTLIHFQVNHASLNPVADVRPEEWVDSVTDSPPSATDLIPLGGPFVGSASPANDDRPEVFDAAPSTLRSAEAPAAAGPEPAEPVKIIVKRRDLADDEELRKQLVQMTELNLASLPARARNAVVTAPKNRKYSPDEIPDYAGLPVRMGVDCQLGKEPADDLQAHSRKLRSALAGSFKRGLERPDADALRKHLDKERDLWLRAEAVPTLSQMLMAEAKPLRMLLVEYLAENASGQATVALAQRALFDLAFEVRDAAIQALARRPAEDFRSVLAEGFRYPWAPVADHAAEALVALKDRAAVPVLEKLVYEPGPEVPHLDYAHGRIAVSELVRVNHLGNCAMCHAPSRSATEPVRGLIPSPTQPLPPLSQYYESTGGSFVRADVTYLRQDFSVPQPVPRPGQWPANQRYDYLVRKRFLTGEELKALAPDTKSDSQKKPIQRSAQKEAAVYALRELRDIDRNEATAVARTD